MRKFDGDNLSLISNDRPCRVRFPPLSLSFQAHAANAMSSRRMLVRVRSHSVIANAEVFYDVCRKCC